MAMARPFGGVWFGIVDCPPALPIAQPQAMVGGPVFASAGQPLRLRKAVRPVAVMLHSSGRQPMETGP
jgi:hypothetical protein